MGAPLNIFADEGTGSAERVAVPPGLITHVADLGSADRAAHALFRRQAAAQADTILTLSERRIGLVLPPRPSLPLSDVPHRLTPIGEGGAIAVPPSAAPETALAALDARLDALAASIGPDALDAAFRTALLPLQDRLDAAENARSDSGLDEAQRSFWAGMETVLDHLHRSLDRMEGYARRDAAIGARLDRAEAAQEDRFAALQNAIQSIAEAQNATDARLARLDERERRHDANLHGTLDAMERTMSRAADVQAATGAVLTRLGEGQDALNKRIEAVFAALNAGVGSLSAEQDKTRSAVLDEIVTRLEPLASAIGSLGTETERRAGETDTRFERLAEAQNALAESLAAQAAAETGAREADAESRERCEAGRRADQAVLLKRLDWLSVDLTRKAPAGAEPAALAAAVMQRIEPHLAALRQTAEPSDAQAGDSSLKSMRNYWSALEDLLGRMSRLLDKMEAAQACGPEAAARALSSGLDELDRMLTRLTVPGFGSGAPPWHGPALSHPKAEARV